MEYVLLFILYSFFSFFNIVLTKLFIIILCLQTAFKSIASKQKAQNAVSLFRYFFGQLSAYNSSSLKEEMLRKVNGQIKIMFEEVHMPCADVFDCLGMLYGYYIATGNISRLHYLCLNAK